MKTISNFLKSFTLLLLAPSTLLLGLDEEADKHVSLATRSMSQETIAKMQEERSHSECTADTEALSDYTTKEEARCGFIFDRYPPVYFPASVHWLYGVSALGDAVEIEDGSVWKINRYDSYKALNWGGNEPIVITQNHRWFSSYTYRLINKNTGSIIEANLSLGPIKNGDFTRYIVPNTTLDVTVPTEVIIDIDPAVSGDVVIEIEPNQTETFLSFDPTAGFVRLNDQTHWRFDPSDAYIYRDWALNDAIIIGSNTGRHADQYECILINVNMNNFVRAKQY